MDTYQSLSEQEILSVLALSPSATALYTSEEIIIQYANQAMLDFWGKDNSIIGLPMALGVPELNGQPFIDILKNVWATGVTYDAVDTPAELLVNGELSTFYFDFTYRALKNERGEVFCILHNATDVTSRNHRNKYLERALFHTEQRMKSIVMTASVGLTVLRGPDFIVELANKPILEMWNRTEREVMGKRLLSIFPELITQPFPKMLKEVFESGKSLAMPEIEAEIHSVDGHQRFYVDFSYDPLFDSDGDVEAILVSVTDITENVVSRKQLEQNEELLQSLNEELTVINEELANANDDLLKSESRFRNTVQQAPVAICILNGADFVVASANDKMLKMMGKTSDIIGKTFVEAIPEFHNQPFLSLLKEVYQTGQIYFGNEEKAVLVHDGKLVEGYFNFIYQPIYNSERQLPEIMIVATEVTEQVQARISLQKAEEKLRFAIDSANAGTWSMDIRTGDFTPSDRYKELFDFLPEEDMSYEATVDAIQDDYRSMVVSARQKAMSDNIPYSLEYPIRLPGGKIKWLKSYGKVENESSENTPLLSGIVLDITEQKMDEIRKNDFIAIVSHELKTPLTSLKGYTQMLNHSAKKKGDEFTSGTLTKIESQVNKMNTLINGFLNVSRLESGKITLNKHIFDLEHLLKECVAEAQLTTSNHSFSIDATCEMRIFADEEKIWAVISNLLSNAVKYSPAGCLIEVSCKRQNEMLTMSIKDAGMGIMEQDREKLFDRFYRVEGTHSNSITGFGIGLYLSAEIIRCHNGKIWIESEYGKGSTFYFSIPAEIPVTTAEKT